MYIFFHCREPRVYKHKKLIIFAQVLYRQHQVLTT